jgi:hypothetical protein
MPLKPRPIARMSGWASKAKCAFAMRLWADFVRTLEDTIQRESVFDGGNLWQVIRERPCRLSLSSAACPSFGADIEFRPSSSRVECVFRPGRAVRGFELHRWIHLAHPRENGIRSIRPKQLAKSLIDLTCFGGKDAPPCGPARSYQK